MLRVLQDAGAVVYGVTDPAQLTQRVPTFSFTIPGFQPREVTEAAIRAGLGIRDGHLYAPRLMRRLKVPVETGVVRVSLVHYNTVGEIHRLGEQEVARIEEEMLAIARNAGFSGSVADFQKKLDADPARMRQQADDAIADPQCRGPYC